jgi:glycosyltransferase involved in cell wall biosynthesis
MKKQTVEIAIPVYNEEKELEKNIHTLYTFCKKNLAKYTWHITIADNASRDMTARIGEKLEKKFPEISLYTLEQKGRGRAVKGVWNASKADFCVYMDLDLSTDLLHLPKLLQALEKGYDIAIGSRLTKGSHVEGRTFIRELTSRALNFFFIQFFFQTHFTDAQCGFKAVTRDVIKTLIPKIKDNEWFFDGELLIVGEKMGYKIYEEPVHWIDNPGSTVRLVSTISGDLQVIWRLLREKPWRN